MDLGLDENRNECKDPLDNAHEIKVEEINEMSAICLDATYFSCYPGEVYYPASDICLLLSELIAAEALSESKEWVKSLKNVLDNITKRISDEQEKAQELKRKENWWKL